MTLKKLLSPVTIIVLTAFNTIGCARSAPQAPASDLAAGQPAIFGGAIVTPDSQFSRTMVGIVDLSDDDQRLVCTATLVTPQIVLTAAHCLYDSKRDFRVAFAKDLGRAREIPESRLRDIESIVIPEPYRENSLKRRSNFYDIAVVKLKSPAPSGWRLMKLPSRAFDTSMQTPIFLAGYGTDSYFRSGTASPGDARLRVTQAQRVDTNSSGMIQVDQTKGTGICVGDSGGPAFIEEENEFVLIGLASSVDNHRGQTNACRGWSNYVNTWIWRSWIQAVIDGFENSTATEQKAD